MGTQILNESIKKAIFLDGYVAPLQKITHEGPSKRSTGRVLDLHMADLD